MRTLLLLVVLFILVGCASGNVRKMWIEDDTEYWMKICDASCKNYRVTAESYLDCSEGDTATIGLASNGIWNVTCED